MSKSDSTAQPEGADSPTTNVEPADDCKEVTESTEQYDLPVVVSERKAMGEVNIEIDYKGPWIQLRLFNNELTINEFCWMDREQARHVGGELLTAAEEYDDRVENA